jgi:hypothetical protein
MELEELLYDSSRKTADIAVGLIGDNPEIFKKFLDFAMKDKGQYAMRAARVVQLSGNHHPELIRPYLKEIIYKFDSFRNDGLRRSMLKIFTERSLNLDEESFGKLVEIGFNCLTDPAEKAAMKMYAMVILRKISQYYPEIKPELIATIEEQIPRSSAAIISVGKQTLTKLHNQQRTDRDMKPGTINF